MKNNNVVQDAKCKCGGKQYCNTGENVTRCDTCDLVIANGAYEDCKHEYTEKECTKCGTVFCFDCCAWTNVHIGGKYELDSMLCPGCGHDYYAK